MKNKASFQLPFNFLSPSIISNTVFPYQVTWNDIAGLDDVITDLKDTVILPIKKKYLFENSRLLQPPKGRKEMLRIYMLVFKK